DAIIRKTAVEDLATVSTRCGPSAVDRDLSGVPSAQAVETAQPDAAIAGREHGPGRGARQALIRGNRPHGHVAKTIEALVRGDPDVAFSILKESAHEIAGQTVRLRVRVRAALVDMQEAAVQRSDPQTAITITQQPSRLESGRRSRNRIGNDLAVL